MLRQLINDGADLSIRRNGRDTARDIAVDCNNTNCIAIIDDYAAAATFLMCVKRHDDHHIQQVENADPDVLHPRIVELAGSDERLVSNWTPTGEGLVRPEISGMFLHDLHGKEEGLTRMIANYIHGPVSKKKTITEEGEQAAEGL